MNYRELLFDPVYRKIGVTATLTTASGIDALLLVIDKTAGVAVGDSPVIETVKPAVRVRAYEVAARNLEVSDLDDGVLTFNGGTWRIKSVRPEPSPAGQLEGELTLFLISADD